MAECLVLKDYLGWKNGDHVEAFDIRLQELVNDGIVKIIVPDVESVKPVENTEVKVDEPVIRRGRPKKGVN